MKTAILSCFHPFRGGIAQFNASLAEELGREHEVRAYNFTRQYPSFLFPGRTQYVTPQDEAVPVESEALLDTVGPLSWRKTASAIRRWNPDALILRYWMPYFAPSLGYVARHLSPHSKVIGILDNVIPHEPHFFDRPFTKYFLKGSHGHITLCEAVAKDLLEIDPGARYKVIQHPLYSHFGKKKERKEAEKKLGLVPGMKNILFFGLIRDYKGLDILIDAFKGLGKEYQLIIAGEPYGSFSKYQDQIDGSGCKDRIHTFLHYIRDSEVKDYFSAADVTVLPYRSATQSGISSISYHFEVPMIVTDVGGMKETVGDKGTGLLADGCNADAIRRAILKYFGDTDIQEQCKTEIRKEKERLSWSSFCRQLTDFSSQLKNSL